MPPPQRSQSSGVPIPAGVRALLEAPNFVHLSTLRKDGSPRNWIVWAGLEDEHVLICTDDTTWKARDMRRDPRIGLSVADAANPYRMAMIQGRVVEVRPDHDLRFMDPIAVRYTGKPFPHRGPTRVCFVVAVKHVGFRELSFEHRPGSASTLPPRD